MERRGRVGAQRGGGRGRALRHQHVGTEHLLLALLREGQGLAAQILVQRLGIDLARITRTVEDLLDGEAGPPTG